MTDPFKTSLNQAWHRISSALHLADALPVVTALIDAEIAYDRREAQFLELNRRDADRIDAVVPALQLLLAVVDLADQPIGIEEDRYQAAITAARAALAEVQEAKTRSQQSAPSSVTNALFSVF